MTSEALLAPAPIADTSEALGSRELLRLVLRTWPYLRREYKHILAWIAATLLIEVVFVAATLVAFDLFNNKVLVGEKLQPAQLQLLLIEDPEYALSEGANAETAEADRMLTKEQRRVVRNRLLVLFAVVALFLLMLSPLLEYYRTWILQRINQTLRVTMIARAEHLSLRYHSHARTGDAIYRVYQDSSMITSVVERIVIEPVVAVAQVVFSFAVITVFSWVLGLVYLAGMVPILWLVAWFTPRLQFRSRVARRTSSALTSRIQEAFSAIRIIKANGAEGRVDRRFTTDSSVALDAAYHLRVELVLMRTWVMLLAGLMLLSGQFLMGGWTVAAEPTFLAGAIALVGFTAWNLGAYESASSRIEEYTENAKYLVALWGVVQDMAVGLDRAFYLLDLEPEVTDAQDAVPMPVPMRTIRYDGVRFGYESTTPVLRGVDLTAAAGTITAIVGATGAGKSTLVSLLLRLYEVDGGTISVNGIPITGIRVDSLRSSVAIALQQNTLFASSVADNIAYASEHPTRAAIEAAATVSCASGFIEDLPAGYDTELGERGSKLSTGQRQRLSIARAVLRNTPVLILDEPTASLDTETEHQVLANLAEWGRDRIVFLITHRISTIRSADQIAFLEDGRIAELGTHEELMAKPGGRYARFVGADLGGSNA